MRNKEMNTMRQNLAWQLEIIFKNVVMRRILDIRVAKAKPSIKDMIMHTLEKKTKKDENRRNQLRD